MQKQENVLPLAIVLAEKPLETNDANAELISRPTGSGYPPEDDPD